MEVFGGCVLLLLCLSHSINANQAPIIDPQIYRVCEDTPIGALAFTIKARDNEGQKLTYELMGNNSIYFNVNKDTGAVYVKMQLDRETHNSYMALEVKVSDGFTPVIAPLTIVLLDANDNAPVFDRSSYDYKVMENTTEGTLLFKVHATDIDLGSARNVRYSIDEVTPSQGLALFGIGKINGEVKLTGSLDFNTNNIYQLRINATDGGGSCYDNKTTTYLSTTVLSLITVVDVPNLDPVFSRLSYEASVPEHSPLHMSVLTVIATDPDKGINDHMIYTIEHSTADGLFAISRDQGEISVASEIDREVVGGVVNLTVKATESKPDINGKNATATATVLIYILDINDNKPEFYKCGETCVVASHFTGEVLEHQIGSIPINMTIKDADVNSRTKLVLVGDVDNILSVQPPIATSDTVVQLHVMNPQKLDFEHIQKMVVNVIAIDEENSTFSSTATVTITITDINDNNPKFPEDTYRLNVSEHTPVGTIIGNITAIDPDTMDQGKITYRLLPDSILQYFNITPDTGLVYVVNQTLIDREVRSLYSATLEARDSDNRVGTAGLEITVTDINDQPPVFNRDSYLAFVREGEQLTLQVQATDADEAGSLNSQIDYAIVPSNYSDNFTIGLTSGELRSVGELDREALDPKLDGEIKLNISATDRGTPPLSSFVTVIINVEDVNDNIPVFGAPSYTFSVKEGEKGAFVGSVFAEDFDQTTDFNRISFRIIDGSFGSFIIRSHADGKGYRGDISVDPDIELDYESTRKQFTLQVEATDLEQEKAVVMVKVNVLDVNDERPVFNTTVVVEVKENTIQGSVGNFTAYDKDGNHSLVYELESEKCRCNGSLTPCNVFILDPTGEVRIKPGATLDYEQCNQVLIAAQVVDVFTEKGENNSVAAGQMVINIVDVNDNAPEFIDRESVFVVVSETASKGTAVATVSATDRDTNTQIKFKVTAVENEDTSRAARRMLFEAVTTQQNGIFVGIIQTVEALDITKKGKYVVTVDATDNGGLSNSTVLEIFTVDETYRVELEFTSSLQDTEAKLSDITKALIGATKASVQIVSIRSDSDTSRATGTIIVAYFVLSNGTALTPEQVVRMLSDGDSYLTLLQLGLKNIGMTGGTIQEDNTEKYVLLGILAGLIVVLLILITALTCTRTKYRRKLRAAKAMNTAAKLTSENQKSGPVVPGTNKYTMEGANPVLNLNIDTTLVLDLDEESSDVDKVSLGSIDISNDVSFPEHDPKMALKMQEKDASVSTGYIEPLSAALAERSPVVKSSNNRLVGFQNPAFNTTDL